MMILELTLDYNNNRLNILDRYNKSYITTL